MSISLPSSLPADLYPIAIIPNLPFTNQCSHTCLGWPIHHFNVSPLRWMYASSCPFSLVFGTGRERGKKTGSGWIGKPISCQALCLVQHGFLFCDLVAKSLILLLDVGSRWVRSIAIDSHYQEVFLSWCYWLLVESHSLSMNHLYYIILCESFMMWG